MPTIETRQATVDDLDSVLADVQSGFDSYLTFAPLGWQPPQIDAERDRIAMRIADPDTWMLLAVVEGITVGHVGIVSAREPAVADASTDRLVRPLIVGLAHLWQLFVLPDWWGKGVGALLHERAVAQMRERGYREARLFTPSLHARARGFYERRGWRAVAEDFNPALELMLTEYRLALG
jgi:GNAT superfamily N-acetyltransferase